MDAENGLIEVDDKVVGPVGKDHRDETVELGPGERQPEGRVKRPEESKDFCGSVCEPA